MRDRGEGAGCRIDDAYIKTRNADHLAYMLAGRRWRQWRTGPYQVQPLPILERRLDMPVCLTPVDAAPRNLERDGVRWHAFFQRAPDVGGSIVDGENGLPAGAEQNVLPTDARQAPLDHERGRAVIGGAWRHGSVNRLVLIHRVVVL
ncbi:hypothetical protein AJ88_15345 [Mesorhizobium amorphae CCBAU 01583]|nr:hypothetical protein AJ88_15345 [Mesorhizobium amorphae CCBAU 01583]